MHNAHQGAVFRLSYIDKPVAKPPSIDAIFFPIVSVELIKCGPLNSVSDGYCFFITRIVRDVGTNHNPAVLIAKAYSELDMACKEGISNLHFPLPVKN